MPFKIDKSSTSKSSNSSASYDSGQNAAPGGDAGSIQNINIAGLNKSGLTLNTVDNGAVSSAFTFARDLAEQAFSATTAALTSNRESFKESISGVLSANEKANTTSGDTNLRYWVVAIVAVVFLWVVVKRG